MFKFIVVAIGIAVILAVLNIGDSEERAAATQYAAARNEAQDRILVGLAAMNDPAVSEFVRDWRASFSQPTPEQLSELRLIEQNIKNDKSVAVKYTVSWKEKNSFCGQLTPVVGSDPGCSPGL